MITKLIDNHVIEELSLYLLEKESELGKSLLQAISLSGAGSLSESVDSFVKGIRAISKNTLQEVSRGEWRRASQDVNSLLWEHIDLLEQVITGFFERLKAVGIEQWETPLVLVVETAYEILMHKIREMYRAIESLQRALVEYRTISLTRRGVNPIISKLKLIFQKKYLDPSMLKSLKRCEILLIQQHQQFNSRYQAYVELSSQLQEGLKKFAHYELLKKFNTDFQTDFQRLYKFLKLWGLNRKTHSLPVGETVAAIRSGFTIERVVELFDTYFRALRSTLFDRSKMLKQGALSLFQEEKSKKLILQGLNGYRAELHTLGVVVEMYRDFYLSSHPDPYIRTRWGFPEWIVGTEPHETKELKGLVYKIERLDRLYAELGLSIHRGPASEETEQLPQKFREIQRIIYEMNQPLTSRPAMRSRSEKVLEKVKEMNELGSFNPEVTEYVGKVFSKVLRADWEYHVLFDFSLFHQLFAVHRGLVPDMEDENHLNRRQHFERIINKLTIWVKKREIGRIDIDKELIVMKQYLQEFLVEAQLKLVMEPIDSVRMIMFISEVSAQLLDYRYVFGIFFNFLNQKEQEGKIVRNQCLFVDEYFDSVENCLHEMRSQLLV